MRIANILFQASLRKNTKFKKKDDILMQLIDHYGKYSPSPLSLRQFLDFGKKLFDRQCFDYISASCCWKRISF